MDDKIIFVVDSIKKLLLLKVSDEEIIAELNGVGISKEDAMDLIRQAKEGDVQKENLSLKNQEEEKKSSLIYDEVSSKLSMDEQVVSQLNIKDANVEAKKENKSKIDSIFENDLGQKDSSSVDYESIQEVSKNQSKAIDNNVLQKNTGSKIFVENSDKEKIFLKGDKSESKLSKTLFSEELDKDSKKEDSNSDLISEIQSNFSQNKTPEKETLTPSQIQNKPETKVENKQVVQISPKNIPEELSKNEIPKVNLSQNFSSSPDENKLNESLQNFSQKTKYPQSGSFSNNYASSLQPKNTNLSKDISNEMDTLWKKGIVVAVNSKLIEMKKLKEEVDSNISEKVDSSVKKEVAQLRVLLDSQRDLLIANNRAALEEKQKEISFIIDSKIIELKQANKQLSTNLAALELAKSEQKASLEQIKQMLEEARRTKAQLLVEMNSELIKSKSQAQAFLDNADKHLHELDNRVNRTLELQKNIADGMIEQAEQKIETLTLQKTGELVEDLEVRLNRLKVIESEINPDLLVQKIKILDDFKKQFVETMKDNITQINVAIEEINKKNADLDQSITQKMLVIDAKVEELTKFEKNFTEIMNNLTEQM